MWRANGNPNPCTILDEILHAYPHQSKEGFGAGLIPAPFPLGQKETFLKTVYKAKNVQQVAN